MGNKFVSTINNQHIIKIIYNNNLNNIIHLIFKQLKLHGTYSKLVTSVF